MTFWRSGPPRRSGRRLRPRDRFLPPIISVTTVLGAIFIVRTIVIRAEQWPRIKAQFFSLPAIIEVFPDVLRGFGINMSVWIVSLVVIALCVIWGQLNAHGIINASPPQPGFVYCGIAFVGAVITTFFARSAMNARDVCLNDRRVTRSQISE